jgi:hypothetical protein
MNDLIGFFIIISIFYLAFFLYFKIEYKWSFLSAFFLFILDIFTNFLQIPEFNSDISFLGILFFIIGWLLVLLDLNQNDLINSDSSN